MALDEGHCVLDLGLSIFYSCFLLLIPALPFTNYLIAVLDCVLSFYACSSLHSWVANAHLKELPKQNLNNSGVAQK